MKTKILLFILIGFLLSCNSEKDVLEKNLAENQVLMLKVDYETNTFEGGAEFNFSTKTDNFTIENEYVEPSDFGSVKLTYKELNETLFIGTIHWLGLGKMTFPKKLKPANNFKIAPLKPYVLPKSGFEDIFNPNNRKLNYEKPWNCVQGLIKVREYLKTNPRQKVRIFLYTPSVGVGNPKDWYWIIYLKK